MDELDKIFENKEELRNTKEVQELINYCQKVFKKNLRIGKMYEDFHDRTLDKIMYSEIILKNGNDTKTVLEAIMQDINDM